MLIAAAVSAYADVVILASSLVFLGGFLTAPRGPAVLPGVRLGGVTSKRRFAILAAANG